MHPLRLLRVSAAFALALPAVSGETHGAPAEPEVEYQSTILPGKKLKFDAQAIYSEDANVLQGFFGSNGNDEIACVLALPDGRIAATGMLGNAAGLSGSLPRPAIPGIQPGGSAFLAVFEPKMRKMEGIILLGADVVRGRKLALGTDGSLFVGADRPDKTQPGLAVFKFSPGVDRLLWRRDVAGDHLTGLAILSDQSCVVSATHHPFLTRIKADGSGPAPFGATEQIRVDLANPEVHAAYWQDLGYAEKGVRMQASLRGGVGGIVATKDDGIVYLASHSIRLGGREFGGAPDFDLMLLRFGPDGKLAWATNLAAGIPNPSDHKLPRIAYDPWTGDILVTAIQHGHFARNQNLILTEAAFLDVDNYFTGDIMIGWIGRIDAATGKVKASTYFFPDLQKAMQAGKRFASSLFPEAILADADGRVYVTGATGYKLQTTLHAFQTDPMGGPGFLAVFDRDLSRLLHCTLITGRGYGARGRTLTLGQLGPVIGSSITPGDPPVEVVVANPEKTNYLSPKLLGGEDGMLSMYPSSTWWQ